MTACNQQPPEGHPFHGTGVACHLRADHIQYGLAHSWEIKTPNPWIARFSNGPCAGGPDRIWTVGPIWGVIRLAPMPPEVAVEWVIVGGDGIGPDEPGIEPWPGEVTYVLDEVFERDEDERIAYYVVQA